MLQNKTAKRNITHDPVEQFCDGYEGKLRNTDLHEVSSYVPNMYRRFLVFKVKQSLSNWMGRAESLQNTNGRDERS